MEDHTDPRLAGEYVRQVYGPRRAVTLVGVVHDHPASIHRVQSRVDELDPAVLALELPPTAVPLFEQYAATSTAPPTFGGEMSAAVQAARTDRVVGVDRPTPAFFGRLVRNLLAERPSAETVEKILGNTVSAAKHAAVCRVAAAVTKHADVRLEVDDPNRHEVDARDPPTVQAEDEHRQVRQSRAFMNAFQTTSSSRASRLEDATREQHMADRLSTLATEGPVVAVVGIDHLDPLARLLEDGDR